MKHFSTKNKSIKEHLGYVEGSLASKLPFKLNGQGYYHLLQSKVKFVYLKFVENSKIAEVLFKIFFKPVTCISYP